MIEVTGNLWDYKADIHCITTNGFVKKDGTCVMGRGCAYEASQKLPYLPKLLGDKITKGGNKVYYLGMPAQWLYSFPVKHNWFEKADLALIERSARELVAAIDALQTEMMAKAHRSFVSGTDSLTVVIPRPGCGNGKLKWPDVRAVLEPILDDRFHIISF